MFAFDIIATDERMRVLTAEVTATVSATSVSESDLDCRTLPAG
ncbi:MAG: hypothetical protein ABW091_05865 [Microbacterium sp.]